MMKIAMLLGALSGAITVSAKLAPIIRKVTIMLSGAITRAADPSLEFAAAAPHIATCQYAFFLFFFFFLLCFCHIETTCGVCSYKTIWSVRPILGTAAANPGLPMGYAGCLCSGLWPTAGDLNRKGLSGGFGGQHYLIPLPLLSRDFSEHLGLPIR